MQVGRTLQVCLARPYVVCDRGRSHRSRLLRTSGIRAHLVGRKKGSHSVAYRITGHSNLSAPTIPLVADEIRAELAQHDPATLVGVSCLARGADQVFARVVLE